MGSKLIKLTLAELPNFVSLGWCLFLSSIFVLRQFFLIIRTQEPDQSIKIVKVALGFGIKKLFINHFDLRVDQNDFVQEVLNLAFVP